jgi:hypothetical protein
LRKRRGPAVDFRQREFRSLCFGADLRRAEIGIDMCLVVQGHGQFEEKVFARDLVHIDCCLRGAMIGRASGKNGQDQDPCGAGFVHGDFSQFRWIRP